MKISQICEETGLTKRAVRFYEEKELIAPEITRINGKDYREYSNSDVRRLRAIVAMRRLGFSLEDIRSMLANPESIGSVAAKYKEQLGREIGRKEKIYRLLSQLCGKDYADIYEFEKAVMRSEEVNDLPPRDVAPDFSKMEELTRREKEKALEDFHKQLIIHNFVSDIMSRVLKTAAFAVLTVALIFVILFAVSWIPKKVEISADGYLCSKDGSVQYEDTVTVKGKIYRPMFNYDFFEGEITFQNTPQLDVKCAREYLYGENDSAKGCAFVEPLAYDDRYRYEITIYTYNGSSDEYGYDLNRTLFISSDLEDVYFAGKGADGTEVYFTAPAKSCKEVQAADTLL